jgi:leucyl-tRNA synthetase
LHEKIKIKISENNNVKDEINRPLEEFNSIIINKININLEKFRYNVIVANLHEIYNFYNNIILNEKTIPNLKSSYINILKTTIPIIPHIAYECINEISSNENFEWPTINKKYLKVKELNIVVQINGKKRGLIQAEESLNEENLIKKIRLNSDLNKYFVNKKIIKNIYIKNKLINFIVN